MRLAVVCRRDQFEIYDHVVARTKGVELSCHINEGDTAPLHLALMDSVDQFDAVCMLSRFADMPTCVRDLAMRGKHVLCAFAGVSLDAAKSLSDASASFDGQVMVAQPGRYTSYATTIREALEAGRLGPPGLLRIHRWHQESAIESSSLDDQLSSALDAEIDLAHAVFGEPPDSIYGAWIQSSERRTGISVHLGFPSGMAMIDVATHEAPDFYTVSLIGADGAVYGDDHRNTNLLLQGKTLGVNLWSQPRKLSSWLGPQLEAFIQMVAAKRRNQSVSDMRSAIAVREAALRSADENKVAVRNGASYELH